MKEIRDTHRARLLRDNMRSTRYRPYCRPSEIISRFLPYTRLGKSHPRFRISIGNPTGGEARKILTGRVELRGFYLGKSLYVGPYCCSDSEVDNIVKIEAETDGEWELIWARPAYRSGGVASGKKVQAGSRPARKPIPNPDWSPEVLESVISKPADPQPASPEFTREPEQLRWDW